MPDGEGILVAVRSAGALDSEVLLVTLERHALYVQARERNPARWSRQTRNWEPIEAVALNPERDVVVNTASLPSPNKTAEAA
jgi:hypothetical protein